jgi:hypothetical protein
MLASILWAIAGALAAATAVGHVMRLHRRIGEFEENAQRERLKSQLPKKPAEQAVGALGFRRAGRGSAGF